MFCPMSGLIFASAIALKTALGGLHRTGFCDIVRE